MSAERIIRVNGVDLCVDTRGDSGDPAILLIGGAASPMDWWEDEFCERLAAGMRYVVRYDKRDTGRSVSYPAGAPRYTAMDLAADVVGVLDALGLGSAHLVGISMGGALAQRVAVDHPDRVESLALISTSPAGPGGPGNPDLPSMSEDLQGYFAAQHAPPDWSDRAAVVNHVVDAERRFAAAGAFRRAARAHPHPGAAAPYLRRLGQAGRPTGVAVDRRGRSDGLVRSPVRRGHGRRGPDAVGSRGAAPDAAAVDAGQRAGSARAAGDRRRLWPGCRRRVRRRARVRHRGVRRRRDRHPRGPTAAPGDQRALPHRRPAELSTGLAGSLRPGRRRLHPPGVARPAPTYRHRQRGADGRPWRHPHRHRGPSR